MATFVVGTANSIPLLFLTFAGWTTLAVTLIFVVGTWLTIKTFRDQGFMNQGQYEAAEGNFSGMVVTNRTALWAFGVILALALWLSVTFYWLQGAQGASGTALANEFLAINSAIFAAVVFHAVAESTFWQATWLGPSLFARVLVFIFIVIAFIVEIIELTTLTAAQPSGFGLFLVIVLGVWIIWTIVLMVRGWAYWSNADSFDTADNQGLIGTSYASASGKGHHAGAPHSGANPRAASAWAAANMGYSPAQGK
jgi:hypothetical protein